MSMIRRCEISNGVTVSGKVVARICGQIIYALTHPICIRYPSKLAKRERLCCTDLSWDKGRYELDERASDDAGVAYRIAVDLGRSLARGRWRPRAGSRGLQGRISRDAVMVARSDGSTVAVSRRRLLRSPRSQLTENASKLAAMLSEA
jgi:hypothetical protein